MNKDQITKEQELFDEKIGKHLYPHSTRGDLMGECHSFVSSLYTRVADAKFKEGYEKGLSVQGNSMMADMVKLKSQNDEARKEGREAALREATVMMMKAVGELADEINEPIAYMKIATKFFAIESAIAELIKGEMILPESKINKALLYGAAIELQQMRREMRLERKKETLGNIRMQSVARVCISMLGNLGYVHFLK